MPLEETFILHKVTILVTLIKIKITTTIKHPQKMFLTISSEINATKVYDSL